MASNKNTSLKQSEHHPLQNIRVSRSYSADNFKIKNKCFMLYMHFQEAVIHSRESCCSYTCRKWNWISFSKISKCCMNLSEQQSTGATLIAHKITIIALFSLYRWDATPLVEIFMHWQDVFTSHVLMGIVSWAGELFWGKPPHIGCCWDRPCHAQRKPKHHLCYEYHIHNQHWDNQL